MIACLAWAGFLGIRVVIDAGWARRAVLGGSLFLPVDTGGRYCLYQLGMHFFIAVKSKIAT